MSAPPQDPPGTAGRWEGQGTAIVGVRDWDAHRLNRRIPTIRTLDSLNSGDRQPLLWTRSIVWIANSLSPYLPTAIFFTLQH